MEHACRQCRIGLSQSESIAEVFHRAGSTTCDDGYGELVGETGESLVGIAVLHTVVIHAGEENLACSALLHFACPFEEPALHPLATAFHVAMPAVGIETGVDGAYAYL